jgi:hypothetical protein
MPSGRDSFRRNRVAPTEFHRITGSGFRRGALFRWGTPSGFVSHFHSPSSNGYSAPLNAGNAGANVGETALEPTSLRGNGMVIDMLFAALNNAGGAFWPLGA